MEHTLLIAQVLGLVYLAVGVGIVMNTKYYTKVFDDLLKSPALLYTLGLAAFILGFFIINSHNYWVRGWEVIVTLIGWGAFIKGGALLIAPQSFVKLAKKMLKKKGNLSRNGFVALLLGAVLVYYGFPA